MQKTLRYALFIAVFFICREARSQNAPAKKDSVIQLYGVVMTTDSLRGIPSTSVIVVGKGRGTFTNNEGIFSIAVQRGDRITFSSIGFKDRTIEIPKDLVGNEWSVVQTMVNDTAYLPITVLKPH